MQTGTQHGGQATQGWLRGGSRAGKQHPLWNLPPKSLPKESHTHARTRAHTNVKPISKKVTPTFPFPPFPPLQLPIPSPAPSCIERHICGGIWTKLKGKGKPMGKTDTRSGGSPNAGSLTLLHHALTPHLSMILDTGQLMGRNTNIRIRLCRCAHAPDTQEKVRGRAQQEQALAACRMGKLSCSMGGASARCITHRTRSTPTRPRW
jgi:hypothetical protein